MTALFLQSSRRIYRPEEAPDNVRDAACSREAEGIEADHLSESVFGTCPETGLQWEEGQKGIKLEAKTSWSIGGKGAGAGLVGSVVDVDRFLSYLETEGTIDREQGRRLRYVERDGGISLRFHKRRGWGEGTVPDSDFGAVEWPSEAIEEAKTALAEVWSDYVRELERRAVRALETEWEWLCSWEVIAERLRDFGEGLDDDGRSWPLADCIEKGEE